MDARPLRCAGDNDLGLSVSAWPKEARSGSQRLVSVGRAQAAAAIVLLPRSGSLLCRGDFERRASFLGWWRASGVRCYLGDVLLAHAGARMARLERGGRQNQRELEGLCASFENTSAADASFAARSTALSWAGRAFALFRADPRIRRELDHSLAQGGLFARCRAVIDRIGCLVTSILSHLWRREPKSAVRRYTPS